MLASWRLKNGTLYENSKRKERMMESLTKSILVPVDGSENALRSLDYLNMMYDPEHNLDVSLLHISPTLPPILADDKSLDRDILSKRRVVEDRKTLSGPSITLGLCSQRPIAI